MSNHPKLAALVLSLLAGALFMVTHNSSSSSQSPPSAPVEVTSSLGCSAAHDSLVLIKNGGPNAAWTTNRDAWQSASSVGGDPNGAASKRATAIAADVQAVIAATPDSRTPRDALERAVRAVPGCAKETAGL